MSSFLQSSEWGEFQKSLGREVIFEPVLAIKHELPKESYYWYVPRGAQVASFVSRVASEGKSKCVFVRVEPTENTTLPKGARKTKNIQPGKTLVLDMAKPDEELLKEMHPKTRYNIKVAERHGVKVSPAEKPVDIAECIELILDTSKRQNFQTYPKSYYEKLIAFFAAGKRVRVSRLPLDTMEVGVLQARREAELLACGIFVDYAGTRIYLFGGSSEQNKNIMAPYLLHWEAIRNAKTAGLEHYDFWGIETSSGKTPGFLRFKMGFGGRPVEYPGAFDIVLKPGWYNTYTFARFLHSKINKIL